MIKKLVIVGLVATAAFVGLRHSKFFRYAKQELSDVHDWVEDQVPVEKKIEQMRKDVANLDRDVESVKDALAREIVEVRELTTDVGKLRASVETEHKGLVKRGEEIRDASEYVAYGRSKVSVAEAKELLKRDVGTHLKRKQQLESLEKTLANRERIKETLEKQLDSMLKQKQELKAEIDAVEAEYKALQLQQMESKYQNDDTRLARVKESLNGLRKKLDIEREKLQLAPRVYDEPATESVSGQSIDEILAPLIKGNTRTIDQARE